MIIGATDTTVAQTVPGGTGNNYTGVLTSGSVASETTKVVLNGRVDSNGNNGRIIIAQNSELEITGELVLQGFNAIVAGDGDNVEENEGVLKLNEFEGYGGLVANFGTIEITDGGSGTGTDGLNGLITAAKNNSSTGSAADGRIGIIHFTGSDSITAGINYGDVLGGKLILSGNQANAINVNIGGADLVLDGATANYTDLTANNITSGKAETDSEITINGNVAADGTVTMAGGNTIFTEDTADSDKTFTAGGVTISNGATMTIDRDMDLQLLTGVDANYYNTLNNGTITVNDSHTLDLGSGYAGNGSINNEGTVTITVDPAR